MSTDHNVDYGDIDFSEDVETGSSVSAQGLKEVSDLAHQAVQYEQKIAEKEQELKDLKAEHRTLIEITIPDTMDNYRLRTFELDDGSSIEVEPVISAGIPAKRADEAFAWLRENGFGALIKRKIAMNFSKGEDEIANDVLRVLHEELNLSVEDKPEVHHQTLKAFVKEQLAKGSNLPRDLLGVYEGRRAKIKQSKK